MVVETKLSKQTNYFNKLHIYRSNIKEIGGHARLLEYVAANIREKLLL
jgi:hypothetical protein